MHIQYVTGELFKIKLREMVEGADVNPSNFAPIIPLISMR